MQKFPDRQLALLIAALMGLFFMALAWLTYALGVWEFKTSDSGDVKGSLANAADPEIMLICEGTYSVPVDGFNAPLRNTTKTFVAGLDFDTGSGWYAGDFVLQEERKGNVSKRDGKVVVSRPALFERHGAMVEGEEFTLDRRTGEFIETLSLGQGRKLTLIKAHCARMVKPPF